MTTAQCSAAIEQIGDAAGQVWHYLNENGPTALSRLVKDVDVPRDVLMQAIGWLAREDKLSIDTESRARQSRCPRIQKTHCGGIPHRGCRRGTEIFFGSASARSFDRVRPDAP